MAEPAPFRAFPRSPFFTIFLSDLFPLLFKQTCRGNLPSMPQSSVQTFPSNCEPCRRRKCRCDRVKPCANCNLRGIADQCYVQAPRIEEGKRVSSRKRSSECHLKEATDRSRPLVSRTNSNLSASPISEAAGTSAFYVDENLDKNKVRFLSFKAADASVKWDDVSPFLPSAGICFRLLNFFFDEVRESRM